MFRYTQNVAFLSWAKPTSDTPEHIKQAAATAIQSGKIGGYLETSGLQALRERIVEKLKRDNNIDGSAKTKKRRMQRLRDPASTERRLRNLIYFNLFIQLTIGQKQI